MTNHITISLFSLAIEIKTMNIFLLFQNFTSEILKKTGNEAVIQLKLMNKMKSSLRLIT